MLVFFELSSIVLIYCSVCSPFTAIVLCQSVARRKLAIDQAKLVAAEHTIQSQWAVYLADNKLVHIREHISFINTINGAWTMLQAKAAIEISSAWRRYHYLAAHKRTINGMSRKKVLMFLLIFLLGY